MCAPISELPSNISTMAFIIMNSKNYGKFILARAKKSLLPSHCQNRFGFRCIIYTVVGVVIVNNRGNKQPCAVEPAVFRGSDPGLFRRDPGVLIQVFSDGRIRVFFQESDPVVFRGSDQGVF